MWCDLKAGQARPKMWPSVGISSVKIRVWVKIWFRPTINGIICIKYFRIVHSIVNFVCDN